MVLPGGGQKHSETLHQALKREVFEEISAKVKIGKLLHIREYFQKNTVLPSKTSKFTRWNSFSNAIWLIHIIQKLVTFPTRIKEVVWVKLDQLDEANFYPETLRKILSNLKKMTPRFTWVNAINLSISPTS